MRTLLCFVAAALANTEALLKALRIVGLTVEKAAIFIGLDRRQLDRQLHGHEHLRVSTIEKLPIEVEQWWHVERLREIGLPAELVGAMPLADALMPRRRMLRAELPVTQEQQKVSA